MFRVAFARARPCYCYGCICLTPDERAYQRRVFKIAHAWGKQLRHERGGRQHLALPIGLCDRGAPLRRIPFGLLAAPGKEGTRVIVRTSGERCPQ